ncbi:MAG TPA: 1,2-phenylacetyl-CoA epoxidase subunit PaaD [Segeticoccus sp.]|uniref:1,2-phenylacetyl-CoA epoxidase subunit PaaD n=1 Tax=Segeticoccus sp. TaxID=2706531 RepID=UPI002D7E9E1A|nr:1,2-phenylacetyl-CoA epoxidase subunit PaaD [Segeticoccus sp.]HET8601366.1 1,2-phenylacetyl-CoA epoxidase subunit PaaD [Segeticoccus sp.]
MTATVARTGSVAEAIARIPDPEVPVITIEDLGILRYCEVDEVARAVRVVITPTYSGCPAMEVIRGRIEHEAARAGYTATVETRLSPAWTTDWMSEAGRDRLREFGIAPPTTRPGGPVPVGLSVRRVTCPLCGSTETEEIARFGSTACKALRRCLACREPFDEFKAV